MHLERLDDKVIKLAVPHHSTEYQRYRKNFQDSSFLIQLESAACQDVVLTIKENSPWKWVSPCGRTKPI